MRACLAFRMLDLAVVVAMFILPLCFAGQSVPNQVRPAPIPTQICSARKVFVSNAGGDELDPRRFGFPTVDPNRIYDQLYASIKAAGKVQLVLAPADADLVLQARFSQSVTALEFHIGGSGDPILKLAVLDPKSNVLLWALSETVPAASGPHWKEKREDNFNQALTKLFNEFSSLCNGGNSIGP
jgi:uncharacterized lipoprotein YajG